MDDGSVLMDNAYNNQLVHQTSMWLNTWTSPSPLLALSQIKLSSSGSYLLLLCYILHKSLCSEVQITQQKQNGRIVKPRCWPLRMAFCKKTKTNPDWSDLCRFPNISVLVQGEYHRCSRDIYSFGLMVQAFTGLKLCESVCVSRVCDSCRCPCPSCSALQPTH